jgi:hypothetical protein
MVSDQKSPVCDGAGLQRTMGQGEGTGGCGLASQTRYKGSWQPRLTGGGGTRYGM